jgi:hypothetical protein
MRTHLAHLFTALAVAAAAVACTGRNHTVGNDRKVQAGGDRGINERVALRGCLQPAPAGEGYALRHIMVLPSAENPAGLDAVEHPLIARGSWVRLAGSRDATDDLKNYLNNEVTITGEIVDRAEGTVGTAGHSGANGDAPRVAIERVKKIADNCAGE